jgi:hypothetical protein
MPRNVPPSQINAGPGAGNPPPGRANFNLNGTGVGSGPPELGTPAHTDAENTIQPGFPDPPTDLGAANADALGDHVRDPINAHPAVSISLDNHPPLLESDNVQGAIDEFMGVIPAEPPKVGMWLPYMAVSGVPYWGNWSLMDDPFTELGGSPTAAQFLSPGETGANVYPLYWQSPTLDANSNPIIVNPVTPTQDNGFVHGQDPLTDPIWGVETGTAVAGAFTNGNPGPVVRTRLVPDQGSGYNEASFSGMVYPADRGVLALIHWPPNGAIADFTAQNILDRCWAALLLGQGIGSPCVESLPDAYRPHDGEPGGIFALGVDSNENYNPFEFPGRATGQYDLSEILRGVSEIDNSALPSPWIGTPRVANTAVPGSGQVRLGTDATISGASSALHGASSSMSGLSPDWGIPILGAGIEAYTGGTLPNGTGAAGQKSWGHSMFPGTPTVNNSVNFFGYRLPYLDDYSPATGLKYTPRGQNGLTTRETARYFRLFSSYNDNTNLTTHIGHIGGVDYLNQAGNYTAYSQDYWIWQIARYRQRVWATSTVGTDIGTLWLIHFKREADFEAFVRDGIMPWDAMYGYDTYSAIPVNTQPDASGNIVNEVTSGNTAPAYGYGSESYHVLRRFVLVGDDSTTPTVSSATWNYGFGTGSAIAVMWCSGVAYFTPGVGGQKPFLFDGLTASASNAWVNGYRADDNPLTGDVSPVPPAQISSPNPALVSIAPFSYGNPLTFTPQAGFTSGRGPRPQRIEFPFQKLGAFSSGTGPQTGDSLGFTLSGTVSFQGDLSTPAFSTDASPHLFIRRPLIPGQPLQPVSSKYTGVRMSLVGNAALKMLFHSTGFNSAGPTGAYGNFYTGGSNRAYSSLNTAAKDTYETFLDEVYRYYFNGVGDPQELQLYGPGMAGWGAGPIAVPVQAGAVVGGDALTWSWLAQNGATNSLAASSHLQVAGLPERNPPATAWVTNPFPSAGLLLYPGVNYTTNTKPTNSECGGTQPDYTSLAGGTALRFYTRAFDAAFIRSSSPAQTEGQQTLILRVDGLELADFAYSSPGPGQTTPADSGGVANGSGIGIMIKVPGLTTWMDVGRFDGDGPSKQDNVRDGAGCKVSGPYTYTAIDPTTGLVYSQIEVNVGPAASLSAGYDTGGGVYEVPILVKVMMGVGNRLNTAYYDMAHTKFTNSNTFITSAVHPSEYPWGVRGVVGIGLVHPNNWTPLTTQMATAASILLSTTLYP